MKPHYKLEAWKESRKLVKVIYELSRAFPQEELYALTSQMRRAAISVLSNIAEGAARGTKREFLHFLDMAHGSLSELESQAIVAVDLGYCDRKHTVFEQLSQVSKLLTGLKRYLRQNDR